MTQPKCLLNTRPLEQGIALNKSIEDIGWHAVHWPALIIQPTPEIWINAMPQLDLIQTAIFISPNAVHFFFKTLQQNNHSWPEKIQTLALGLASADALRGYNINSTCIPMMADSENLLDMPELKNVSSRQILLIKGVGGRELIEVSLAASGANIHKLDVYQRAAPTEISDELMHLWKKDAIDLILFTSQQSMQNLWCLLEEPARIWMCRTPCLVISPRLAAAAKSYGVHSVIQTTWPNMINTIKEFTHDDSRNNSQTK